MYRLLQINSVVGYGSTGRIVEMLGEKSIENGFSSYIAYGRSCLASNSNIIKIGSRYSIIQHGLLSYGFDRHGFGSKYSTIKFIKEIDRIKPNLIHLHNIHGYYINIEILFNYLLKTNIPIIWTLHDCWSFTGHCAYFSYKECEKWKRHCSNCPQINSYPRSICFDNSELNFLKKKKLFTSLNNLTIVTVSEWLSSIVSNSFLNIYPRIVINNGIDLSIFYKRNSSDFIKDKYGIQNKTILIGVATSWSHRKGLYDYHKLSKILPQDVVIVLVGLTDKEIKKLPKNIVGIKKTNNVDELANLYSAADVVMNLSYEETFGMTTIEGFACGTPSIVYNATASPELIDEKTGIIVEKGNIEGVLNAIYLILQKSKEYYSNACIEKAKRMYNKENRYLDYINLYKDILDQKKTQII